MILYEKGLIFESKRNINTINLNQSHNYCLHSLESKDLVCIIYLLTLFSMLLFLFILALNNTYVLELL